MHSHLGRLHLITDTRPGRDPVRTVREALRGAGHRAAQLVVQVRVEDGTSDRDAYELATRIVALCRAAGATCLVNDRLDVALAAGAHGAHVGAEDLPVPAARRVLHAGALPGAEALPGGGALLGATARDPRAARLAVAEGASYLGVGPAYPTSTKDGLPDPIGVAGVAAVAAAVPVPVIAIGGVTRERVPVLRRAGAYGVAVVGAICSAPDPAAATADLLEALESVPQEAW